MRSKANLYARKIAETSLSIGAIKLRPDAPFVWASGFRMPIYNDNRMLLGSYANREMIFQGFWYAVIGENIKFDCVAGTSTAGIPHATTFADMNKKPLTYVRDKPKDHGLRNQIEGLDAEKNYEGKKVILVEDLISTGGSSANAVNAIRKANGEINYCMCIFNYGFDAANEMFEGKIPFDKDGNILVPKCNIITLLDYDTLLEVASERNYVNDAQITMLQEWRSDPFGWGEKHGFPKIERGK